MRSTYSSDEEIFNSDDSVMGGFGSRKVGVVVKNNDNFAYVDAMTNRLNETDLRLLRASINDRPKPNPAGDNEGGSFPDKFLHEQELTNQDFERKVKFDPRAKRPDNRKNQVSASNQGNTNITNNYTEMIQKSGKKATGSADFNSKNVLKGSGREATQGGDGRETEQKEDENDDYVYRGPKNRTGIFKNSLILKDLTGYQDMPEPASLSITMDAGTQTILHEEEPKIYDNRKGDVDILNYNAEKAIGTYTHVGTPNKKSLNHLYPSTNRNSVEVLDKKKNGIKTDQLIGDSSLDRLDREAMSMQPEEDDQQHINITNQVNHQYIQKRNPTNDYGN